MRQRPTLEINPIKTNIWKVEESRRAEIPQTTRIKHEKISWSCQGIKRCQVILSFFTRIISNYFCWYTVTINWYTITINEIFNVIFVGWSVFLSNKNLSDMPVHVNLSKFFLFNQSFYNLIIRHSVMNKAKYRQNKSYYACNQS